VYADGKVERDIPRLVSYFYPISFARIMTRRRKMLRPGNGRRKLYERVFFPPKFGRVLFRVRTICHRPARRSTGPTRRIARRYIRGGDVVAYVWKNGSSVERLGRNETGRKFRSTCGANVVFRRLVRDVWNATVVGP